MRAADLDDVGEGAAFARARPQRPAPAAAAHDRFGGGDVHRGREDVVRRLAAVDVVVRVDGGFAAHRPPSISIARLAMTSLAFMLVCVPEPVCQTTSGK
jgi:hypothetical protein